MIHPSLLATGFVVDAPGDGTLFPSAGGNSGDPRVQAVYWRCLVTLFASARITNPDQRLALFSNAAPPAIDGVEIAGVLERYGVELHRVELSARLAPGRSPAWGNVLYFFDILAALHSEADGLRFALVDSDVLVMAPLAPLFALLGEADYAGYRLESAADEPINGLTRRKMAGMASTLAGRPFPPLPHYGGELFATTLGQWRRDEAQFRLLLEQAQAGQGPAAGILTEEHIFSIAFALLGRPVADSGHLLKRIWTSPRHNTARPGDELLTLWHLPAEKRHGLGDLFAALAHRHFPLDMPADTFRALAMQLCGVPRKGLRKIARDGWRSMTARLGPRR